MKRVIWSLIVMLSIASVLSLMAACDNENGNGGDGDGDSSDGGSSSHTFSITDWGSINSYTGPGE